MAGDGLAEIMVNFVLPPNAGINGISPKSLLLTYSVEKLLLNI